MIKPTFVIVILGILASVAIPRLAGTKADAEISAAVANLRTLVSDASVYHVTKGEFGSAKWNEITNVPLKDATATTAIGTTPTAHLTVGGKNCIGIHLVEKTDAADVTTPAHIKFTKLSGVDSVCTQVQNAEPVKAYVDSTVPNGTNTIDNAIAIGSSTSVYTN